MKNPLLYTGVIEECNLHVKTDEDTFIKHLTESYEITKLKDDYVECWLVNSYLRLCDPSLTDTKIGRLLTGLGIEPGRKGGKRVRFGLKSKAALEEILEG